MSRKKLLATVIISTFSLFSVAINNPIHMDITVTCLLTRYIRNVRMFIGYSSTTDIAPSVNVVSMTQLLECVRIRMIIIQAIYTHCPWRKIKYASMDKTNNVSRRFGFFQCFNVFLHSLNHCVPVGKGPYRGRDIITVEFVSTFERSANHRLSCEFHSRPC